MQLNARFGCSVGSTEHPNRAFSTYMCTRLYMCVCKYQMKVICEHSTEN